MTDILLNDGWELTDTSPDTAENNSPDKNAVWERVTLPHDCLIGRADNLYRDGVYWYKKSFSVAESAEKLTFLCFEGVYMDCAVFVNGLKVGGNRYGYTEFELDITDSVSKGENTVLVRCVCLFPSARWYTGAGIYRSVHLITRRENHIRANGVYISSEYSDGKYTLYADTEICGDGDIQHTVLDGDGSVIAETTGKIASCVIASPIEWDTARPYLYKLITVLYTDGKPTDSCENDFGLRRAELNPDKGFFLNGRHIKLNGVCLHHDLGCLGAADNGSAIERRLLRMLDMGANAVRTAHNPPSREFMTLCDRLGLMVVSECFDIWERPKNAHDYSRFFPEGHRRDLESWVKRDRNHPCLIMWSIGNEIVDTHLGERGRLITRELSALVGTLDYRHNAYTTICSNYMPWKNAQLCADELDAAGYNYCSRLYRAHHAENPRRVIYGSETASIVQTRGVYHFPLAQKTLTDDDGQCSSLGNCVTSWGAKSVEQCITDERDAEFSLGQFVWSGYDYIGEPTPYHSRCSYFGFVDTAGFPKDIYYIFKAEWNKKAEPFIHLFPYWDFNDGQLIDIRACTNMSCAELFLNGKSLGKRTIDHKRGRELLADWRAEYESGVIEAVAYHTDGSVAARCARHSFGDTAALVIAADRETLPVGGDTLAFIEISAEDTCGIPVENANNRVYVTVSGCGRLVGIDNGNSADSDSYKGGNMRMSGGKLLAVVAAADKEGELCVVAQSEGIHGARLVLSVTGDNKAAAAESVYSAEAMPDTAREISDKSRPREIPVRKIALFSDSGRTLTREKKTVKIHCRLYPENASYTEVEWRLTDAAGIDTNLAELSADGNNAVITALGDGKFYARCATKNGGDGISLYSQLEFSASGIGETRLNPYKFVSCGLYSATGGEIGNGNERGIATARDGVSWAAYKNVGFGAFGSDEIKLDIFCLDSDPLEIEIMNGIPETEGAYIVSRVIYQKPSIWNTYQSESFRLDERFAGVSTIAFRLGRKAHIRGFAFTRQEKAFSRLYAGECSRITGDSFTRRGKEINNIGNNVTLDFDGMDFGEKGVSSVRINGRTALEQCPIQIRFVSDSAEQVELAGFVGRDGFSEQVFGFEKKLGRFDVSFVFMPGSSFDFSDFTFI